jgi:hypothetical protein
MELEAGYVYWIGSRDQTTKHLRGDVDIHWRWKKNKYTMPNRCNLRAQNIPTCFPTATQARMLPNQFPVSQLTIHRCWLTQFYFSDQPIQTWFLWLLSNRKESGYHGSFVLHVCIIFGRANLSVNPPESAWKDLPQRERTVNWGGPTFWHAWRFLLCTCFLDVCEAFWCAMRLWIWSNLVWKFENKFLCKREI